MRLTIKGCLQSRAANNRVNTVLHNTPVTKQWATNWSYTTNAVSEL